MPGKPIGIDIQPLSLKLKSTFRHAGAERKVGDSVWVRARREALVGFGEGCPRSYSAGDDTPSSVQWVRETFCHQALPFHNLEGLTSWVKNNNSLIDRYPSAWCALEMALLDLFAREQGCSVEALLGLPDIRRRGVYTAVLGDDNTWKFTTIVDQYLVRGFSDFKIKVSGNLERDRKKIDILNDLVRQHGISAPRIRLDANNLWKDRVAEAGSYLHALGGQLFAVEEPVGRGDSEGSSKVSTSTGLPVILDESLCTGMDLAKFKTLPGNYIANIKVSRVGGLLRALMLIKQLKTIGWPIIVGCHVGETSLLTRAALIPACAAGETLIGQEGAYGDYLVAREPAEPMLKFGREGVLDLDRPYYLKDIEGLKMVPTDNWHTGFGMQCRWPVAPGDGKPDVLVLEMPDHYEVHYRRWGPAEGDDVLVILHGGMSHSGWQAPLATAVRAVEPTMAIVAPDRRGCGLNAGHGDLGSVRSVIEDVVTHIEFLKTSFKRVHLVGWSQGSQYAAVAAQQAGALLASLILLAPGFFWNERFRSVIKIAENNIFSMVKNLKVKPAREQAYVPILMEAADFTLQDEWLDFIENDDLKTTMVTMKTAHIVDEIQALSWPAILENKLPTLAILAENDRMVDNRKVRQFLGHMFPGETGNRLVRLASGHAVQFEMPGDVAAEILRFIRERGKLCT